MRPETHIDWLDRVNRAIDHIQATLQQPLGLEEIARRVHTSPYHFHRIFKAITGETLHGFQKRVRLQRALVLMARGSDDLTHIAWMCGFSGSSDFSRSFRARFGVPPSRFDLDAWQQARRGQLEDLDPTGRLARLPAGDNPDGLTARVVDLPPRTLVYHRVTRPFEGTRVRDATAAFVAWAEAQGVADGDWYGWMFEDPDIVPLELCRYDVAVTIDAARPRDPGVGRIDLPAMRVAEVEVSGEIDVEQRALDWLYGTWLPDSGYGIAPWPCAEAWAGRPFAHGETWFALTLQLPIR